MPRTTRFVPDVKQTGEGVEEVSLPAPEDRRKAREIADAGADLIVGHHAHCIQPYERYRQAYIFYGLGNWIFPDLDEPSFFDAAGTSTRRFVKRQQYWNRRSLGVEYDIGSGDVWVSEYKFDGAALRCTKAGAQPKPWSAPLDSEEYDRRFRRTYAFAVLRNKAFAFLSDPKVPSPRHLRSLAKIAGEAGSAPIQR